MASTEDLARQLAALRSRIELLEGDQATERHARALMDADLGSLVTRERATLTLIEALAANQRNQATKSDVAETNRRIDGLSEGLQAITGLLNQLILRGE